MLQLRVHRSELTYEATLWRPLAAVIDTPGKAVSAFLAEFDHLDVGISDLSLDDGPLEDKGLRCEVDKLDASIVLRADRVEIRFASIDKTGDDATGAMQAVWKAIAATSPQAAAKSHALLFEMDCAIPGGSYRGALDQFCRPHENLPEGTETAVVYYLPQDASQDLLNCSFVLNRSAEVQGGVLVAVTLVFEGNLRPERIVPAGRERLKDLLTRLDITLLQNAEAGK
ncbi:MAG: hypothetical protein ACLQOO_28180 [Terriglobia bacterium]